MAPHRPGQCFWLWNRTVDVFAPGTGTRRIKARMQKIAEERDDALDRAAAATSESAFLRRELLRLSGEHNVLLAQDEWNEALAVVVHESPFVSSHLPPSKDTENTMPMEVVN